MQRILRLSDYTNAGFLAQDLRNLAPKAYIEWCQQQEIIRVKAGGEASFLLASLEDSSWIWQSERLNLNATQAFNKQKIRICDESSFQSIDSAQVVLAGNRDWQHLAAVVLEFGLDVNSDILDVGCGYGAAAHHLKGIFLDIREWTWKHPF